MTQGRRSGWRARCSTTARSGHDRRCCPGRSAPPSDERRRRRTTSGTWPRPAVGRRGCSTPTARPGRPRTGRRVEPRTPAVDRVSRRSWSVGLPLGLVPARRSASSASTLRSRKSSRRSNWSRRLAGIGTAVRAARTEMIGERVGERARADATRTSSTGSLATAPSCRCVRSRAAPASSGPRGCCE